MEKLNFRPKVGQGKDIGFGVHAVAPEPVELILGEEIRDLEKRLAVWVGAELCVAVSDAASGIALALKAAGIGKGDQVFCAALGCALPVQGILMAGALPVFVDINPNTYTADPFCLEYAINKLKRDCREIPRALIATDLFGAPCHLSELEQICESRGITLIEDMSGAFGARYRGRALGSFGRFSVTSFASPGLLAELGGGAVFCRNEEDAAQIAALRRAGRQQCMDESRIPYMGSADASLIWMRLESLGEEHLRRRKAAARYRENLMGKVRVQQMVEGGESVYSQMVVTLPGPGIRAQVTKYLFHMNIPSGLPLCGLQKSCNDWNRAMLINTHSLSDRLLALPIHSHLSRHVVDFICESLLSAIDV